MSKNSIILRSLSSPHITHSEVERRQEEHQAGMDRQTHGQAERHIVPIKVHLASSILC
jgi:hypothetical protein